VRADLPQAVQQVGQAVRVVEGGAGGGPAGVEVAPGETDILILAAAAVLDTTARPAR
jgi:hypothetical protein